MASCASSRFVVPQILIQVIPMPHKVDSSRADKPIRNVRLRNRDLLGNRRFQQIAQCFAWRECPHQGFTNQEALITSCSKPSNVLPCMDAAFGNTDHIIWDPLCQMKCGIQIDFESAQVAAVYANEVAACVERPA